MSRFWEKTSDSTVTVEPVQQSTFVLFIDEDSDKVKLVNIDTLTDPLSMLDWNDFKVSECLKHGITYKSLNITPDLRFGHEEEFDALAKRFDDLKSNLYKQSE